MILRLANHCNIALNQETLLLLHPLGGFKHYELLNAYKYKRLEIRGAYKVNAGVSGQTFVYPLKIAFYLSKYVTT